MSVKEQIPKKPPNIHDKNCPVADLGKDYTLVADMSKDLLSAIKEHKINE